MNNTYYQNNLSITIVNIITSRFNETAPVFNNHIVILRAHTCFRLLTEVFWYWQISWFHQNRLDSLGLIFSTCVKMVEKGRHGQYLILQVVLQCCKLFVVTICSGSKWIQSLETIQKHTHSVSPSMGQQKSYWIPDWVCICLLQKNGG